MQPYKDHTAHTVAGVTQNEDGDSVIHQPPRYVHHDATMFKPINEQQQDATSSSTQQNNNNNNAATKGFISDHSKRRKVEELQRTIEFTDRMVESAEQTVLASKVAIGMEAVALSMCAFLANFGLRHSNPQQSVLRKFADTNLRLARFGSFYTLIGGAGMMMSMSYIPMEYQAIENSEMSVKKLQDTNMRAMGERNVLLEEMARAVGMDPETGEMRPEEDD